MMTARPTADDIIAAPRTRGAFAESVPASEFRAELAGLTCSAVCEPLVHHRQQYATTRAL